MVKNSKLRSQNPKHFTQNSKLHNKIRNAIVKTRIFVVDIGNFVTKTQSFIKILNKNSKLRRQKFKTSQWTCGQNPKLFSQTSRIGN